MTTVDEVLAARSITFVDAAITFVLPSWANPIEGSQPSHCRTCQAPILFVRSIAGKSSPINPDGISHFATCPQADAWRSS